MLDLKAKLLAAGIVTAEQVKKVEEEEAARKQRAKERRDAEQRRREQHAHGERRGEPRDSRPDDRRGGERRRDRRDEDPDVKRARREHEWNEAQRWRARLDALKAAGKSEQYEAIRGWVMRDRLDNKQISDAAVRFHFVKHDATLSHLTIEPDVQQRLVEGSAGIVAFMGYNGLEHAVVPKDVAEDIRAVRPEWLRHLIGVTDIEPPIALAPAAPPTDTAVDAASTTKADDTSPESESA